jgi:type II secretory pathway component PulM
MASAFPSLRTPPAFARWWGAKAHGERRIVAALTTIIVAAIGWLVVWQPLQRDVAALSASVPAQRRAVVEGQRMADEMAGLARAGAVAAAGDPRADLERVLTQRGIRGAATQIDWQEGRARVVFATVAIDTLIPTMEALQRDAGLRVVDATLTARVEPGNVRAELVLAR